MRKNCPSVRKKIEKKFWDMEIIGNRRKITSSARLSRSIGIACFSCGVSTKDIKN